MSDSLLRRQFNVYTEVQRQWKATLERLAPLIHVSYDGIDDGELTETDILIYTHHYCCGGMDHDTTAIPLALAEEFLNADEAKQAQIVATLKQQRIDKAAADAQKAKEDYEASEEKRMREQYEKLRTRFEPKP